MSERYKLGLTRNRLFEFDNCALFCGKLGFECEISAIEKALKTLCIKEPLLTAKIVLENDGTAYVVTRSVEPEIKKDSRNSSEILNEYEKNGIDFWEHLFAFSISGDGCLVIAGHTTVCDAKSLLRLASDFVSFCKRNAVGVEVSTINLFSEISDLPLEVASPIVDRLADELDSRWSEKDKSYAVEDYKKAKSLYCEKTSVRGELRGMLTNDILSGIQSYCAENNLDVSSVVAFSFYESLVNNIGADKKYNKMNVYADTRFFFENYTDYGVGAFNGVVTADLNKKENSKALDERIKHFHLDCYKGSTSPFRVFYDDVLQMKLTPSLCDSSYMYSVGMAKNKASKKLAQNYGCGLEKICDFFSCNLEQSFWRGLEDYISLDVFEPFRMRSSTYVGFVRRNGEGYITFKYKKDKCSDLQAEKIMAESINLIRKIAGI